MVSFSWALRSSDTHPGLKVNSRLPDKEQKIMVMKQPLVLIEQTERERYDTNPISIPVRSSDWGDGFYHGAEGSDSLQWIMGKNYEDVIRYISGLIWIHTIYLVYSYKSEA